MEFEERLGVKLEYGISCFAKRKEFKDLNAKNENLKQKMGFLVLAKHGLNKTWIRANLVSFLRDQTVEREREGKWKREKKRKRKKRRREEEEDGGAKRYGTNLVYGTTWNSKVLYEFPCLDG